MFTRGAFAAVSLLATACVQSVGAQGNYWLGDATLKHGNLPGTPNGYQFFRNVKNFGAKGDGVTDDTKAINIAMRALNEQDRTDARCGWDNKCGSSSTLGGLVYFPPGTYLVSEPIIHYFYTQIVGDAASVPTIKAASNFTSETLFALIDADPYVPRGEGKQWYINQNQFFRQIRNLKLDLANAPTPGDPNALGTVGIHWQVSQATSLQNIAVTLPQGSTRHIGMYTENGSGGFICDVEVKFGMYGWLVGSQQYLGRALNFINNIEAVKMNWDWGFVWKSISISSTYKTFNVAQYDQAGGQGVGSLTVVDSYFDNVPYGITLNQNSPAPNIVLDNVFNIGNGPSIVQYDGGATLLPAQGLPTVVNTWVLGNVVNSTDGKVTEVKTGWNPGSQSRPASLVDGSGKIFERSKPQYGNVPRSSVVNVLDNGISNEGKTDQSAAINALLSAKVGSLIFFPAGVYLVADTIFVPVGSKLVGEGWSQIMAYGPKFADEANPRVMVKVANPGESGVVEISDFLFTVRGATAGAVLVEWNIHESVQGSAGLWDSHFRVGGATGSDLTIKECNRTTSIDSIKPSCKAASLLLHLTPKSSGYFENVWGWVADHDLDEPIDPTKETDTSGTMINVYSARGMLIESQGPTWMYATAAEHNTLYQYQIVNAKNLYMAHLQTETPYYQPGIPADKPYTPRSSPRFASDPSYDHCTGQPADSGCLSSWAMRIVNSTDVLIHGGGMYSFFNSYKKCAGEAPAVGGICQERVFETVNSQRVSWWNIYTVGSREIVSPKGGVPVLASTATQRGYSTEIAAWLPFWK